MPMSSSVKYGNSVVLLMIGREDEKELWKNDFQNTTISQSLDMTYRYTLCQHKRIASLAYLYTLDISLRPVFPLLERHQTISCPLGPL